MRREVHVRFCERLAVTFRGPTLPGFQATALFSCALIFAQRFLAALEIFARPAADNTRFLAVVTSRLADLPKALLPIANYSNHAVA
jgi:hypothetical protein